MSTDTLDKSFGSKSKGLSENRIKTTAAPGNGLAQFY